MKDDEDFYRYVNQKSSFSVKFLTAQNNDVKSVPVDGGHMEHNFF